MTGQTDRSARPAPYAFWLFAGALGLGTWYQIHRFDDVERQIDGMGQEAIDRSTLVHTLDSALDRELLGVQEELAVIRSEIRAAAAEAEEARLLAERLSNTEDRLGAIGSTIEAQSSRLAELQETQTSFGPEQVSAQLEERDERISRRWETFDGLLESVRQTAVESQRGVEELGQALTPRDLAGMWQDLVGPVVQLAGDTSVGSGVLLRSRPNPDGAGYRTYMITAWHVVRDIQGDLSRTDEPIPTTIYGEDGSLRHESAELLCFDPELDSALLQLITPDALENGARIASRARLDEVAIFDQVYAVGCPLGNDPIPTYGEIATCEHRVEGETYWMINAPTYIGNSGGGIFDSETHALLGIFSKIYTHGSLRPTIVPHMGLVTPLSGIYDWLEEEGYSIQETTADAGEAKVASLQPR